MIARKAKQTRYVVWVGDKQGYWMPSWPMSRHEADTLANKLDMMGKPFRIVLAPTFDPGEDA
jgi:hypothetical protein